VAPAEGLAAEGAQVGAVAGLTRLADVAAAEVVQAAALRPVLCSH